MLMFSLSVVQLHERTPAASTWWDTDVKLRGRSKARSTLSACNVIALLWLSAFRIGSHYKPHLNSCAEPEPFSKQYIAKLESVQRKAIRFIFNKYRRLDSPTELIRQAELPPIQNRARLLRLKFLFLLLNGSMKINASDFLLQTDTRSSRTKHTKHLTEYRFHNDIFRYSFFPQAIREWNLLPDDVVTCTSLQTFIAKLTNNAF